MIFLNSGRCILLNADYTFLSFINWKKAISLHVKGKAEVLKQSDKPIRYDNGLKRIFAPLVMKLVKLIRSIFRTHVPFSRKNIMIRDKYECAYCGQSVGRDLKLTIDHVVPISRGGKSTFENCVTSCFTCNNKKRNLLPSEAGMFIRKKTYSPTISEFLQLKIEQLGLNNTLKELGIF